MENRKNLILEVKNVAIKGGWMRNFAGNPDRFNPNGGARYFNFVIDDEQLAKNLIDDGWNVKSYQRDEESEIEYTLKVKIGRFVDYIKRVDNINRHIVDLIDPKDPEDQDAIACLDYERIESANLRIVGRAWDDGITAYLKAGVFKIRVDDLLEEFAEDECPEELPFD